MTSRSPTVLMYVQYLQGVGHLVRAGHIARALRAAGAEVHLVTGGMPVPTLRFDGITLHQLAPVKIRSGDFSDLITETGAPHTDDLRAERRDHLLKIFEDVAPDALVVEAFPFGRRQMRFELLPLLEAAKARSVKNNTFCSIREILQENRKPGRAAETVELVAQFFDHVLVHGDAHLVTLKDTFELADQIEDRITYTGMVTDPAQDIPPTTGTGAGGVLVSAGGGGTFSEVLLQAALDARPLTTKAKDLPWRLLAGSNMADAAFHALQAQAGPGVIVERNRPDFPELLSEAAVSVSQAGYNTATDILRCGCRSVLVPYAHRGETEQTRRATQFQARGFATTVGADALTPEALARAIDAELAKPMPGPAEIDMTGAETSARIILETIGRA